jgi:hypothetical protein
MACDESANTNPLKHSDFSKRAPSELSEAERAELNRRYDSFMRHFRASETTSAPSTGMARRIRKWHP